MRSSAKWTWLRTAKDLVYFDRVGNTLRALRNTGGSGTGRYVHTREYDGVWPFPELHDWMLLRDYNCDGRGHLFVHLCRFRRIPQHLHE